MLGELNHLALLLGKPKVKRQCRPDARTYERPMVPTGWRSVVLLLLPTMRFTGFAPEALESWLARSEASALVVAGGFRQLHPGGRPLHGLLGRLGLGALHQNFAGALTRLSCGPFSCRNARMVSRPSLMGSGSPLAHDWSVGDWVTRKTSRPSKSQKCSRKLRHVYLIYTPAGSASITHVVPHVFFKGMYPTEALSSSA